MAKLPPYCVSVFLHLCRWNLRLNLCLLRNHRLVRQVYADWDFRFGVVNFTRHFMGRFFHDIPLLHG